METHGETFTSSVIDYVAQYEENYNIRTSIDISELSEAWGSDMHGDISRTRNMFIIDSGEDLSNSYNKLHGS